MSARFSLAVTKTQMSQNKSAKGFILSIFPLVNTLGLQGGYADPTTVMGYAQKGLSTTQWVCWGVIIISIFLIVLPGDQIVAAVADKNRCTKKSAATTEYSPIRIVGYGVLAVVVACLVAATVMSMITGIVIATRGEYL